MANFDAAIKVLLQHEGGFVNDPQDAGGATNFGITQRDNPTLDIPNLTVEQATQYYYTHWWMKYMLNQINDDDLATYMLDHGVNTGMNAMVVVVQAAVNTVADGQIGPHTIAAINSTYQPSMLPTIMNGLWAHYQKILVAHPEDEKFRNGWHNRCFSL